MRKIWYWMREIVWTAVLSAVLVVCAVVLEVLGFHELALILVIGAVPFALLSMRI